MTRVPFYSTHDWTIEPPNVDRFHEMWVDAKSPGDGRTYVGTIQVRNTQPPALFSEHSIEKSPPNWPSVVIIGNGAFRKQVVCLQVVNDDQTIAWQRYFYGDSGLLGDANLRETNARGISVWPGATELETRIAICGETYDIALPSSNAPGGWAQANGSASSGFIAVYRGDGLLLWSHHFFANPAGVGPQDCAITDVSIRREGIDGDSPSDVVTYCGISTHGALTTPSPLTPEHFHTTSYPGGSVGNTNYGPAQWDGFVGRLVRPDASSTTTKAFHALLCGQGQDGLFGIAEIDADRFVVVGSATLSTTTPSFPVVWSWFSPWVGTVTMFDSAPTRIGQDLVFQGSYPVGRSSASGKGEGVPLHTIARDVVVRYHGGVSGEHSVVVVGSTDNTQILFEGAVAPLSSVPAVNTTGTDGWMGMFLDLAGSPTPWAFERFGDQGLGNDGLTGVQGWNEFSDSVAVVGFFEPAAQGGTTGSTRIRAETAFFDMAPFPPGSPFQAPGPQAFRKIRHYELAAVAQPCIPTATGPKNALSSGGGHPWDRFALGDPNGGGVTVDPRGRTTVVGTTEGAYPTFGTTVFPVVQARAFRSQSDAVRTTMDMIPMDVGRTDGTGNDLPNGLPAGYTGGTTPACGLRPFGIRIRHEAGIGYLEYPPLQRILLDYEGPEPSNSFPNLIVSRPPYDPQLQLINGQMGLLQFDVPNSTPPIMLPEGVELWTTNNGILVPIAVGFPFQPMRVPMGPIPAGLDFTVQCLFVVLHPVPGFGCQGQFTSYVGSPALWLHN